MAQKVEGKMRQDEAGELTIVVSTSGYLIGRMEGGNKLLKPRIVELTQDKQIHMRPLLGLPPFVVVHDFFCMYKLSVREEQIIRLYNQVTDPKVDPGV